MDETLKRLLDAEQRANQLVESAIAERDRMIAKALDEVRGAEERFEARLPELRGTFMEKAEERARQSVSELQRRHREQRGEIERMAGERRAQAEAAALAKLLGNA